MRKIKYLIIHCSATPEGREHTAADIDKWHKQRGFRKIGYHYVIQIDGIVEAGRPIREVGAHAKGKNANSIGICYIGGCDVNMKPKDTLTPAQSKSLYRIVTECLFLFPKAKVAGHYHFANKACPSFDIPAWCMNNGILAENIYKPK